MLNCQKKRFFPVVCRLDDWTFDLLDQRHKEEGFIAALLLRTTMIKSLITTSKKSCAGDIQIVPHVNSIEVATNHRSCLRVSLF